MGMALFFFVSWLALLVFNVFLKNARQQRRNGINWIFAKVGGFLCENVMENEGKF